MNCVYPVAFGLVVGFAVGSYLAHRYYAPLAATAKAYVFSLTGETVHSVRETQGILRAVLRQLAQKLN